MKGIFGGIKVFRFLIMIAVFMHSLLTVSTSWASRASGLCFPMSAQAESEDWPICAVYMHGLFGGQPYSASLWEVPFRKRFERIALNKRCKIAAPFGNQGRYRNWNGVSLGEVLVRARAVCDGGKLGARPAIIGFSNGANRLRRMGVVSCLGLQRFSRVTLVGPTGVQGNSTVLRCGNVRIHQMHDVPSYEELSASVR